LAGASRLREQPFPQLIKEISMSKVHQLRQALGKAKDELGNIKETGPEHIKLSAAKKELKGLVNDGAAFDAKEAEIGDLAKLCARVEKAKQAEIDDLEQQIETAVKEVARSASLARPLNGGEGDASTADEGEIAKSSLPGLIQQMRNYSAREARKASFEDCISMARKGIGFSVDRSKHFTSFGEQLQAVQHHYASKGSSTDSRLVRAPTGAGEYDPTAGGFLVQVDFETSIFMLSHDMGEILNRVAKTPISANSNGLKIPGVDETSRATGSRWGGVSSAWVADGIAGSESKPKFRLVEFDLKKLISKMTVTDELLADQTALTSIAAQAFSEEIMFMTEDAIFEGTGSGQPQGILSASALVTVAKENGQAAGTIVKENIDKMWSRMWSRSRQNAVWLINQDIEPQLQALNGAVGTGGSLVYMPPGGISAAPYATLYGKPLISTEYNAALGAPGDIALVDLSQYRLVDKGGVQMATSMHIAFDTDEMRFRITYRVDGKSMWTSALTPFRGSLTKSPFVALAQR
jgi:HK97 family phage major capsid protein